MTNASATSRVTEAFSFMREVLGILWFAVERVELDDARPFVLRTDLLNDLNNLCFCFVGHGVMSIEQIPRTEPLNVKDPFL